MNSSFLLCSIAVAVGFFTFLTKFRFQQNNEDAKSSSLSLPSPPTSLSRNCKHHVFPSFHGADVRKTFLSHILESFRRKGIDSFIDNEIERSKSIGPELVEAIQGSKIAIILLSKNYASSSWCLDELAEIMKCREVFGLIVMTIFYEVDPTNIKKQTGDFGNALKKTCKDKSKEHINRWRKALEDVAKIAGEHSRNWGNEAAMVEKIATDVSNILNSSTPSRDFDGLVGMRAHMEKMKQLLRLDLDEVRMIGVWGPPGIGKTTIARFIFDQVSSRFQFSAIMVNIRGRYPRLLLDEYSAQLELHKQMLFQITNQKEIFISNLGVAKDRLNDKKVFLVLDEVDHVGQLDALAKEIQWFGPGSRIIITTEDLRVLNAHGINHIYKVDFPSSDEALQIFCMHAFGQKQPYKGFYNLAIDVTNLAGQLPLGLKVLGSALRGMSKPEWERTLPRLKTRLDGKIGSIIKLSYDALHDDDKNLFLYIACLFIHESADTVEEVLANKLSNVRQGLHVLAEKSLISIEERKINMHSLIQQFGREASHKEFVHHGLAKRQLLVGEKDTCEVLNDETTDSRRFIGIKLDLPMIEEDLNISEKALERMHDFQFVRINGTYLDQPERLQSVLQGLIYHSPKIRSLHWTYFPNLFLPSTFNPEYLVELVMRFSKLQKLWEGTKPPLRNLKWVDLSSSKYLKELPDLSTATNLKELNLEGCSSLVELPSIENSIKLEQMNLDNCLSLVTLPSSIWNATNLQRFSLKNCISVEELPAIKNATNLQILELSNCSSLLELPPIGTAINLMILNISGCSRLVKLSASIGDFTNLRLFSLDNCSSLVELPFSIMNAPNLQRFSVRNCFSLVKLPAIENATNLQILELNNCSSLIEIPASIGTAKNLETLNISGCSKLVKLPSSIGDITNLRVFNLYNCSSLLELPSSIKDFTNLIEFDLSYCSSLLELPPIGAATTFWRLDLSGCSRLVKLPSSIGDITKLGVFDLSDCSSLVELPLSIGTATNLGRLELCGCSSLVKLPYTIGDLTNLTNFDLSNCSSLLEISPSIGTATNLQTLDISGCSSLVKLPSSIGDIINLKVFNLSDCTSLVELPFIGNLQQLYTLRMCGCSKLENLPTNINLESLHTLDLTDCSQLKSFPEISTNIEYLSLIGTGIKEIPLSIMAWSRLSDFHLAYFESLKDFPHALNIITLLHLNEDIQDVGPWVKLISRLRVLRLYDCNNLVSLPQFSDSLSDFVADNCKSLERLDCSFNNPEICLNFINCFNLNHEARDLIMKTSTREYAMLPGTEVPTCFSYRATAGASLTIKLNESPLPTSLRFKACIVLVNGKAETTNDDDDDDDDLDVGSSMSVYIKDKQKDLKVPCTQGYQFIKQLLTEHIYTFEVEARDVTSTELFFKFTLKNSKWKVGECGLLQIWEVI